MPTVTVDASDNPTVTHSPLAYCEEELTPAADVLAAWIFNRMDDTASGECPVCHGEMSYAVERIAVTMSHKKATAGGAPRKIVCACRTPHRDAGDQCGCGRFWYVRILTDGTTPAIVPETDPSIKLMADNFAAMATDPKAQEATIRAAAEKWVGAITALLGLFGLGGIAFGKDVFTGLSNDARWVLAIALVLAVCTAAVAVLRIYRAAYGWPEIVDVSNTRGLKKWYLKGLQAPGRAADNLRAGVYLALGSVLTLCVGAATALWAHPHAPLIEVTRTDDSKICGELLNSADTGKLRIRRANGSVETLNAAAMAKVATVPKCGG